MDLDLVFNSAMVVSGFRRGICGSCTFLQSQLLVHNVFRMSPLIYLLKTLGSECITRKNVSGGHGSIEIKPDFNT